MIGNVLHTFGIRFIGAIISFGVLLLNAQYLGAEGLGTVGLIILNVSLVVLVCNLVHGGLIYFSSRLNRGNLILISYLWTFLSLGIYYSINQLYPLIESDYLLATLILGALQAISGIHLYLILGKEKIKIYNWINLIQSFILIGFISYSYYGLNDFEVQAVIDAFTLAYGSSMLLSLLLSLKEWQIPSLSSLFSDFKQCLTYGFYSQAANTFQLLNYRISYFFLDALSGRVSLGHYTAGVQLSEALLIPARSISTVQYARISRRKSEVYARRISLFFMKLSCLVSILGVLVLLLIPTSFYQLMLGDEFSVVKPIILAMSVGIVALAAEIILSQYFSGRGRVKINMQSAAIGFVISLIGCVVLIKPYGAIGAAITTTLSYLSMFLYLFLRMNAEHKFSWSLILPTRSDFQLWGRIWKMIASKSNR